MIIAIFTPMKLKACTSALACCLASMAQAQNLVVDPFLGEPFRVMSFDVGENQQFRSTLISYPFGSSRKTDCTQDSTATCVEQNKGTERPKAAVLYIHGFNDYYFQKITAEKLDSAGYAFFAVDLHNYGRSYRKGETLGELRNVSEYFPELDSTLGKMRQMVGDSVPLVLLGHSTGGLISLVYAAARENGKDFDAIVLNSPFLEMNSPWLLRDVLVPLVSPLGQWFPGLVIPRGSEDNYSESLLKNRKGEWEFDTTLKVPGSIPVDLGWIAAIHDGQKLVQAGMELVPPILVMHSSCSAKEKDWSDEYTHCDGVLDIDDIRNYGAHLGSDVRLVKIQDALHDLYLSRKDVRDNAYQVTIQFLDDLFARDVVQPCEAAKQESEN